MTDQKEITAIVLDKTGDKVTPSIKTLSEADLPEGEVTINVAYSTINYKDGMILKGLGNMVKTYPHVSGIDYSGIVESSNSPKFKPGDEIIVTGWRVGEHFWGGYATKARAKADWLVKRPETMSLKQAMAHGTAGFTAMLAVMALEEHGLTPDSEGEVLVTGASGGVGSVAVALLAGLGYRVAASTGRAETHDYLRELGATSIVDRSELETPPKGPLGAQRWSGAIDNVGGSTLASVLASLHYWSSCAAVGLAGSAKFTSSLIPFFYRGINLLGIDSGTCPMERRQKAWQRLADEVPADKLERITTVIPLEEVIEVGGKILQGQVRGRTVVDLRG